MDIRHLSYSEANVENEWFSLKLSHFIPTPTIYLREEIYHTFKKWRASRDRLIPSLTHSP